MFHDLDEVRARARRALAEVDPHPDAYGREFDGNRTNAGRSLPEPYLVRLLLIDLLGFPHTGPEEKVAWTVPLKFRGRTLVVAHRKMGLGIFSGDLANDEGSARDLAGRIHKAVKAARPFFDWLAGRAVAKSELNVVNNSAQLLARFEFMLRTYRNKRDEALACEDQQIVTGFVDGHGTPKTVSLPTPERLEREDEGRWLVLAVVDAFFSWTEHIFVHLGILMGKAQTGHEVTALAEANWPDKFKSVMDLSDPTTKLLFDDLLEIRTEMRNFMAHGAFGKGGRAFEFHSAAGAVPVLLPKEAGSRRFEIADATYFDDAATVATIEKFADHLWSGGRSPARLYIQESGLPLILTMAINGEYAGAMQSEEDMERLVAGLHQMFDQAANMDW